MVGTRPTVRSRGSVGLVFRVFYWSRGSVNVNTSRVTHDNRLLLHTLYMTPDEKCVVRGFIPGSIYPER